ncbi:SDR family NAD(P)-dependent oxidoreductase [Rudaea cellulosilytica]|uniref:SDR family NAD(P)-dependent oxidoreductase n=1 Tax=Rudaea cellulosilytica TaxID=540746 RepID=UPI00036EA6F1|nr:SDR family oxidoreductase [Rudaea cellulosilytica]
MNPDFSAPVPGVRRALVTGASAGIGAEFARQLAASGHALVLTARRADRLAALAEELKAAHGVQVDCIAADLADPHTPAALCDELARRGLAIDVLINNAGYGVPGSLLSQPWQVHADFIQVLMTAPVELAWRLLPGMRERGYGRIVNVASLAGHVPAPAGHTLYAASKAYLIKFSQALALENRARGVHVCALCPGFTYSEFHDVTGSRALVSQMPKWLWMQADRVVREGLAAVERGDAVYIPGRVNRTIKGLIKLLPDSVGLRMAAREGRKFRVADDASPST